MFMKYASLNFSPLGFSPFLRVHLIFRSYVFILDFVLPSPYFRNNTKIAGSTSFPQFFFYQTDVTAATQLPWVRASEYAAYYSCDDQFIIIDKAVDSCRRWAGSYMKTSGELKDQRLSHGDGPLHSLGNMVSSRCNTIKEDIEEGRLRYLTRALVAFLVKVFSLVRTLGCRREGRLENIHPSDILVHVPNDDNTAAETVEEDHLTPCLERLQKLEVMLGQLRNKPAHIPMDKEQMLQESWDRIKSIEFDLDKTKKVLKATLVKQQEISETLESVQEPNAKLLYRLKVKHSLPIESDVIGRLAAYPVVRSLGVQKYPQ